MFDRRTKKIPNSNRPKTARPPTTPPTIAPTGVDEPPPPDEAAVVVDAMMLLVDDEEELDVVVLVSVELDGVVSGMLLDPVRTNSRKLLPSVSPL